MDDEPALLGAVCAAPADDLPRLVFADWLEENDEGDRVARASFIRTQIRLAKFAPPKLLIATAVRGTFRGEVEEVTVAPDAVPEPGERVDVEVSTSRHTAGRHVDWTVTAVSDESLAGVFNVRLRRAPWAERAAYEALLTDQHGLLVRHMEDTSGVIPDLPDADMPDASFWGYVGDDEPSRFWLYPALRDQYPVVQVAGCRLRQTFSRGFVGALAGPFSELVRHLPVAIATHPVERVFVTDRVPNYGPGSWYFPRPGEGTPRSEPPAEFFHDGRLSRGWMSQPEADRALSDYLIDRAR